MSGAPLVEKRWSAALVDAGVDVRDAHLRLNVVDPVVVADIGLGRSGETEDRGGQPAGDDGGKSELLHFGAFFFVVFEPWRGSRGSDAVSAGF
jgi:hypothetical protein